MIELKDFKNILSLMQMLQVDEPRDEVLIQQYNQYLACDTQSRKKLEDHLIKSIKPSVMRLYKVINKTEA